MWGEGSLGGLSMTSFKHKQKGACAVCMDTRDVQPLLFVFFRTQEWKMSTRADTPTPRGDSAVTTVKDSKNDDRGCTEGKSHHGRQCL